MKENKVLVNFMKNWFLPIVFMALVIIVIFQLVLRSISQAENTVENVIEGEEGKVTTITESELEGMVKKSELYLIEYPHNGYVEVKDSKGKTDYYVAYHGSVKAGIDFDKIECSLDEKSNTINIKLPEVIIEEPTVDVGSMDYIFINKKSETEVIAQEAYEYVLQDLKEQTLSDEQLKAAALESAKATETALIEPWLDQYFENEYKLNVYQGGNEDER